MRDSDPFKHARFDDRLPRQNAFNPVHAGRACSLGLPSAAKLQRYCREPQSRLSGRLAIRVVGGYVACLHVLTTKAQAA
jgi:hypothetical protein